MNPADKHYLSTVVDIIKELEDSVKLEGMEGEALVGYEEALADLRYACTLGKVTLFFHLVLVCEHVPIGDREQAYSTACMDVAARVDKLADNDRWSFGDG